MNRKTQRLIGSLLFALAGALLLWAREPVASDTQAPPPPPAPPSQGGEIVATTTASTTTNALIIRAVDGDTLVAKIDGEAQEFKIRLLGVNTPESVDPRRAVQCFGHEASKHTADLTEGKRARLVEDPEADEHDKYGRLLRNVVLADGTDLNAVLIKDGYAYAYVSFPQNKKRKAELKRLQDEAKAEQRGLWDPKTCNGLK